MRISVFPIYALVFLAVVGAAFAPSPLMAQLVDYFVIQFPSISPNGDGVQDSSAVRIALLATCADLVVTIEDSSTGSPLDTLLHVSNAAPGAYAAVWKGQDALGQILPGGSYTMHLLASAPPVAQNLRRTVVVDTTAPLVALDRLEPGIYTPGVPGTPEKVLIYFSISRYGEGDTTSVIATTPVGETLRTPVSAHGNGPHIAEWSLPSTAADGIYRLRLVIADQAGKSSADSGTVDVDTSPPALSFINRPPHSTNQPPATISGKCHDRNGIGTLSLYWDKSAALAPDSTFMRGDTLIWRFDAIDSLRKGSGYKECLHKFKVKCSDVFGHTAEDSLAFRLDLTAPRQPELNKLPETVHKAALMVTGTVVPTDSVSQVDVYWLWEGDTAASKESKPQAIGSAGFDVAITLREGKSRIWAVTQDKLGNRSAPSQPDTVRFELATAITHPEVFRGPDVFRVYTAHPARKVTIEIYTVSGELVATLVKGGPGTDFEFNWNLRNNDGENVRNGPYLAIFTVKYETSQTVDKRLIAVVR